MNFDEDLMQTAIGADRADFPAEAERIARAYGYSSRRALALLEKVRNEQHAPQYRRLGRL